MPASASLFLKRSIASSNDDFRGLSFAMLLFYGGIPVATSRLQTARMSTAEDAIRFAFIKELT